MDANSLHLLFSFENSNLSFAVFGLLKFLYILGGGNEMRASHTLYRLQKDQRIIDRIGDQRSNNAVEQHHFANGNEPVNILKVSYFFFSQILLSHLKIFSN